MPRGPAGPGGVGGVGGPVGPGGVGGVGGPVGPGGVGGVGGPGGPGGVGGVGGPGGPGVSAASAVPEGRVASAASVAEDRAVWRRRWPRKASADGDCFSNSLLSERTPGRSTDGAPKKLAQQERGKSDGCYGASAPYHPHQLVDHRTWLATCDIRRINMTQETAKLRKPSNAYSIFILVLTVLSLAVMVVLLLPLSEATLTLLRFYDNLICAIFLIDFVLNLRGAAKKSDYFIGQRGWLDLLGSIPSFGVLETRWPLAPGPPEPAGAHHSTAARRSEKGAGQGRPRSPQPVRGVYYHLFDDPGPDRCQCARAAVRESIAGCEYHHGWGRALVCDRHHHHRGVWRLLPCHYCGTNYCDIDHVRGCRHHRRPGQYSRQPAGRAIDFC